MISYNEFQNFVFSLNAKENPDYIAQAWEVFDHSSDDRIDYKQMIERVNVSVS